MSVIKVETTQNVFIEYNLAGLGERILAFIMDFIIIVLYIWAIIFIAIKSQIEAIIDTTTAYILLFIFLYLPISMYSLVQEVFFNGQTIGKRILGIKVITTRGKQPSLTQYMVRWLFRVIDIWSNLGIVGIVVAASNPYNQRLGDLAAGTCLIKLKNKTELSKQLIIPEFHQLYEPKYTQVVLLSDTDINLVKEALLTYKKYQNQEILETFANKIKEILQINTTDKNEKFLNRIVKDYTYLTSKED
ncbi:MAG: RDD family protein [Raineya sp.]